VERVFDHRLATMLQLDGAVLPNAERE